MVRGSGSEGDKVRAPELNDNGGLSVDRPVALGDRPSSKREVQDGSGGGTSERPGRSQWSTSRFRSSAACAGLSSVQDSSPGSE